MDKEDLELIKSEFDQDRKRWTDIRIQRIFSYSDLKIKIAERKFQFTLFLSSISITFIVLILPLTLNSDHSFPLVSILGFLSTSIFGFLRIFLSIIVDSKEIPKDEKIEMSYWKKCQGLAMKIYNQALDGNVSKTDLDKYFALGEKAESLFENRKKEKEPIHRSLTYIYYTFLFSFIVAFISFSYDFIQLLSEVY